MRGKIKTRAFALAFLLGISLSLRAQTETLTPVAADAVPQIGTFFSTQNRPPLPYDWLPENFPVYSLGSGSFVVDDSAVNYANLKNANGYSKDDVPLPGGGDDGGGSTNSPDGISYSFSTNGLWLGISGITDGVVSLTLNNATNYVYEIFSTTSLTNPLSDWNIETEVFPTNQDVMPFTVPVLDRTNNLFFFARDWTGITSNGNTVPDWWLFYWYGVAGLSAGVSPHFLKSLTAVENVG